MMIEERRASILNGGPELSQSLTGEWSGVAHRFKPVRLPCSVTLRRHARTKSPTNAQLKTEEASHFMAEIS